MSSSPLALLFLIFVIAFDTSFLLMSGSESGSLNENDKLFLSSKSSLEYSRLLSFLIVLA